MNLPKQVQLICDSAGGHWSIYSKNLVTGKTIFELNPDTPFPAASVGKLQIALHVLSEVDKGERSLGDTLKLTDGVRMGGSGVLQHLHSGLEITLLDMLHLMLIVSDNICAKMFVVEFTPQKINAYMKENGFAVTSLKIDGDKFGFGMTTAKEMSVLLEGLHNYNFLSKDLTDKLLGIMKMSDDNRIRRRLPHDTHNTEVKLQIACKSGTIPGVVAGVGIVFEEEPYTVCILSKDLPDKSYTDDNKGVVAVADISKLIYEQATAQ